MSRTLYTCGIDWQHEICEAHDLEGKMPFFSSVEELKANKKCWKTCGIVEIKAELVKWVEPQDLLGEDLPD